MNTVEQALVRRVSKQELTRWVKEDAPAYQELMAYYRAALAQTEARIARLREELALQFESDPAESVRAELKNADVIVDAILSDRSELTAENIEKIDDVAAVTVVCTFASELYHLADALEQERDISVLGREDAVETPRGDGYRGLHLLLGVPVSLRGRTRRIKVEVRLRTGAMQLWSDVEQKIGRKKDIMVPAQVRQELRACAALGAELDERLEQIRYNIEHRVITK